MTRSYGVLGLVALTMLSGCHFIRGKTGCHASQAYMQAQDLPSLKIPAGLEKPASTTALVILPAEGTLIARGPKETCLEEPPQAGLKKPLPRS